MEFRIMNNIPNTKAIFKKNEDGVYCIELLEEKKQTLGDMACGRTVKIGNREFIVLHQNGKTTALICKGFAKEMEFGNSGDWQSSDVRAYCNGEFYNELVNAVGAENIVKHTVDLLAQDGTGEGVSCEDNVSLLTLDMYRHYRKYLPNYGKWWWLATRLNADDEDYARSVCFVHSHGFLFWDDCDVCHGVRPFCILNSSVLVP